MSQAPSSSDVARASVSFTILLGSLTAFDPLSIDMYLPAFPNIGKDLLASSAQVELSLSSFFIGLAVGQIIYGPLSDRYGRKKPLLAGMSVYFVSCFACAYSHSIHMLIFFRVLQALGGCSGMVIARAIVRDVFEKQRAAQIFSLLMLVMGVAPVLAPLAGGYVVKYFGWRAIFEVLGTLSLVSSICSLLFLPETHPPSRERPSIVSSLRGAGAILRDKEFLGYALTGGTVMAGMFAYIAGSPFVFINLFGVRPEHYGWIFGLNAMGIIIASQINGVLLRKFHLESIVRVVVCCTCVFAIGLFVASRLSHSMVAYLIPLFLFITTIGFTVPNTNAGALAHQRQRAGTASSLVGTMQWSIACLASFLVSMLHNGTSGPMTEMILASGLSGFLIFQIGVPKQKPVFPAEARQSDIVSTE
jgi:DHA1 family bicyclomycin/chloramphenicol resistance-like MFS transporter